MVVTASLTPPFLVVRPGVTFWLERRHPNELRGYAQAVREGCFDDAYCLDLVGRMWPVAGYCLPGCHPIRRVLMLMVPIELQLGVPHPDALERVLQDLKTTLTSDTEVVDYLREAGEGPGPILEGLEQCDTTESLFQLLEAEECKMRW